MEKKGSINIAISRKQYRAIEDFINKHPEMGYDSVSQAIKEAIRQWLQKKKMEEKYFISESMNDVEVQVP